MEPVCELFAAVEALRFVEDAERAMQDHPATQGHFSAVGYIAGLVADRIESIASRMDDAEWRPVAPQDGVEQAVTH